MPPALARMTAELAAVTGEVVTAKLPALAPTGVTRLAAAGRATPVLLDESATWTSPPPPEPAAHSSVAVPVDPAEPVAGLGERASERRPIGRTVRPALFVTPW